MNNPQVTMHSQSSNGTLLAHEKALEAAGLALTVASRIKAPYRPLANQLIRAAASVPANLSEGHGRSGRDRQYHWRIAYASAKETDTHLQLLTVAGAVDSVQAMNVIKLFDEVRAMTWRLLHPLR